MSNVKEVKKTKSVKGTNSKTTKSKSSSKTVKKETVKKSTINKPMKVSEITLEEANSFYHVSLLAQAVCVTGILFITILALFEHSFTIPVEVLVGITLLIMAYNNVKLFKRKGFTLVYVIFGTISLIVGILGYFGVTL